MTFTEFLSFLVPWTYTGAALAVTVTMSVIAYAAFAYDKDQACNGGWRVPESTLLYLAMFGGWPGAKIAQSHHRHKTRKEPFRTILNAIGVLQAVILALLLFMPDRQLGEVLNQVLTATTAPETGASQPWIQHSDQASAHESPIPNRFHPNNADY